MWIGVGGDGLLSLCFVQNQGRAKAFLHVPRGVFDAARLQPGTDEDVVVVSTLKKAKTSPSSE